jgi:hypothetical protein
MKKAIICIGLIVLLGLSTILPVYTLKAYHSNTTASTMAWTQWPFGIKTSYNYQESPLESYLKENLKEPIEYDWISSRGTRKNLYGNVLVRAHGRPNRLLGQPDEFLEIWIEHTSRSEILEFYHTLKSRKYEEVELAISKFFAQSEKLLDKHWQIQSR